MSVGLKCKRGIMRVYLPNQRERIQKFGFFVNISNRQKASTDAFRSTLRSLLPPSRVPVEQPEVEEGVRLEK